MTQKVLVSGSAGFIGGYVVGELLRRGYRVTGIDDLSKYGRVMQSYDGHPGYAFVKGDVRDVERMTSLLADCSMVFESAADWPSYEGQQLEVPPPLSSYGFQKLAVEYFARAAWEQYQLPYTIVRPFNCVGIGEARALGDTEITSGNIKLAMSHVVPDLVQKVLKGQDPLYILGSGEQVRHYTYGGDLAAGIVTAMEHPEAVNDDFNLSTSESTTVRALAALIWRKIKGADIPLRLVHDDPFEYDVQRRVPSTDKAKRILGFEAATSLEEMLDEVVPWISRAVAAGTI